MPTERKAKAIEELEKLMKDSTIVVGTDYTGMPVTTMSGLRRALREKGAKFQVVKNTLAYRAADAARKPAIKEVIQGPTGVIFGFQDPVESTKVLVDFLRVNRIQGKVRGGVLGTRKLSPKEIEELATLPSRDQLAARVLGQMMAPMASLLYVLNGPAGALARVLQRRIEQMEQAGAAPAAPQTS